MIRERTKQIVEFRCPFCHEWIRDSDCDYHMTAEHDVEISTIEKLKDRFQYLGGIDCREKTIDII
jgi:hypothetical protein